MAVTTTNLGVITAYGDAVAAGYTGTKAEWQTLMASYATVAEEANQAKDDAVSAKNTAVAKATEATTAATNANTAKDTATSKATEATTAANTATTKAGEASASAQSIAQSAAQIQENTDDIDELKNTLTDKADTTDMLKAFPTDTASGSVASFPDGANVPVKSLVVNIDPVQEGSGDPSPDNVRPISGWSEVNVNACGVNVWDEEWEFGILNSNGEEAPNANTIRAKNYIQVEPNREYFVYSGSNKFVYGFFYDVNKVLVGKANARNMTFTTPSKAYYYRFSMGSEYGTSYLNNISINYPPSDHDYHPYSGQSINIQLGQTVYGGKIDVTNGVLTVDRAMVDLGTLTWSYLSGMFVAYLDGFKDNAMGSTGIIPNAICSAYKASTLANVYGSEDGIFSLGTTSNYANRALFKDSRYTDATAFKAAVTGQTLVYELATPITVQLTPHEVRSLLGDNNVWADSGDSEVVYRADPTLYIQKKIAEAISALS